MLPMKPSALSSEDSYKIIRAYIKEKIDGRYAEITSDYDFCFTVKKKIKLTTPYTETFSPIFGKGKSRKELISNRSVQIFEMTDDVKKYNGYTPIKGFVGKDHADLKKNIPGGRAA